MHTYIIQHTRSAIQCTIPSIEKKFFHSTKINFFVHSMNEKKETDVHVNISFTIALDTKQSGSIDDVEEGALYCQRLLYINLPVYCRIFIFLGSCDAQIFREFNWQKQRKSIKFVASTFNLILTVTLARKNVLPVPCKS